MLSSLRSTALAAVFVFCVPITVFGDTAPLKSVTEILAQERLQLVALGAKRAKRIAGIGSKPFLRAVRWSRSKSQKPRLRPTITKAAKADFLVVSSFKEVNELPKASGGSEWECLTEALYFEARGENFDGISAVAEVIINRKNSPKFPNSICSVISQGVGGRPGCQFSYNCDGKAEVYHEPKAYVRVAKMAKLKLDGRLKKLTDGALFYHTKTVRPSWSRKFRQTVNVGGHLFYKPS